MPPQVSTLNVRELLSEQTSQERAVAAGHKAAERRQLKEIEAIDRKTAAVRAVLTSIEIERVVTGRKVAEHMRSYYEQLKHKTEPKHKTDAADASYEERKIFVFPSPQEPKHRREKFRSRMARLSAHVDAKAATAAAPQEEAHTEEQLHPPPAGGKVKYVSTMTAIAVASLWLAAR